jgi:hypothetical protein
MQSRFSQSAGLSLLPYPEGRGFAFTIIDDTDGATLETTRPVYDELSELGLRTTKTTWVQPHHMASPRTCDAGDTLERPAYAAYLRLLQSRGFEIAMHNISSGDNLREEIAAGIERFREILGEYPAINVHHEKSRENLYFRFAQDASRLPPTFHTAPFRRLQELISRKGATPAECPCSGEEHSSPYFWGDICRARIRYVRSNVFLAKLNTLQCSPQTPYASVETPYVNRWFDSSNGQDAETFNAILSEPNIDRLEKERGCCILYAHFGKGFVASGKHGPTLNEATRSRLRDVAGRRDGWFVPVSTLLDRLAAVQQVLFCRLPRGMAIVNRNTLPVHSLTLQGRPGEIWRDLIGNRFQAGATGRFVLPVLAAGSSTVLLPSDTVVDACRWFDEDSSPWITDVHKALSRARDHLGLGIRALLRGQDPARASRSREIQP